MVDPDELYIKLVDDIQETKQTLIESSDTNTTLKIFATLNYLLSLQEQAVLMKILRAIRNLEPPPPGSPEAIKYSLALQTIISRLDMILGMDDRE